MNKAIEFPPLLTGVAVPGDPWDAALDAVAGDFEPGTVFYGLDEAAMRVAILLAPEEALRDAVRAIFAVMLGFNDALGALAPPEVAVHLQWDGGLRINGARCGKLRIAASTTAHQELPDWLVVGLDLPLWPKSDNPGETPEGCEPGFDAYCDGGTGNPGEEPEEEPPAFCELYPTDPACNVEIF